MLCSKTPRCPTVSEEQCLYQIYLDELYGGLQKPNEEEKKKYVIYTVAYFIISVTFTDQYLYVFCRLAEKKATIGYTYEDSTVTEPDPQSDKDEENSENSESEEDEGIPDIGEGVSYLL